MASLEAVISFRVGAAPSIDIFVFFLRTVRQVLSRTLVLGSGQLPPWTFFSPFFLLTVWQVLSRTLVLGSGRLPPWTFGRTFSRLNFFSPLNIALLFPNIMSSNKNIIQEISLVAIYDQIHSA